MNIEIESMKNWIDTDREENKAVIISGGTINREHALRLLRSHEFKYIITADAGLEFLYREKITPTYIVGDFDSIEQGVLEHYMSNPDVKIRVYNPIKDKTDTEIAIHLALELHASEIWILGGTGGRIDHTLGNIQAMVTPMKRGVPCILADDQNEIRVIDSDFSISREEAFGRYLSLFPLGGVVKELTVTGVKYPLLGHDLEPCNSLGVSNEIIGRANISFCSGVLIVIMSRDSKR